MQTHPTTILSDDTTTTTAQTTHCYHCGDPCPPQQALVFDEKPFCCHGCQTVYEILAENDLCTYYDLNSQAGITLKNRDFGDKFTFLDNPKIAAQLADFYSDTFVKVTLYLPNVHCSSCIWLLENLHRLREGIQYARVNFVRKNITLSFNPQQISFRQVAELLTTLGYEPQISLQDWKSKQQKNQNRSLYYKLGLAGFCFGNIMLLSFPDYLASHDWVSLFEQRFFLYVSIALALPLTFYSGSDYLISAFKALRARQINLDVPLSIGILALFGRSIYEILAQVGTGYLDSLAGLIFFLLIGRWMQSYTYESLSFERDYTAYFPLAVLKWLPDGTLQSTVVTELKVGDRIQIRNLELIPTDSILQSDKALLDYSFVSGEAKPIAKTQGEYLYAGGRQMGAAITVEVRKTVAQSYLTQLWNSEAFGKPQPERALARQVALFSRYFTLVTLLIAVAAGAYWYVYNPAYLWQSFTAVLIVACPCALSLSMPFALGNMMRLWGRHKLYLKNVEVIPALQEIDTIVFDKTGTLTQAHADKVRFEGAWREEWATAVGALCRQSTHPLSRAIAQALAFSNLPVEGFEEVVGKGITGQVDGHLWRLGSASWVKGQARTDANTQTQVHLSCDGHYAGYFVFENQYRTGLPATIAELKKRYALVLLTGDSDSEQATLQQYFGADAALHFNQRPEDKLAFVQSLQSQGKKVLMVGDGLNDAGALKQAHVGIAISEDTGSFSPACDMIMDAQQLRHLPQVLQLAKQSKRIVRNSFLLSLVYNAIGLGWAVSGNLSPVFAAILMPVSSMSVVGFAVWCTALAVHRAGLAVEK